MHVDRRGRRHAFMQFDLRDAGPECADVRAGLAQPLQALRDQPRDGGLAIGTGDANDANACRRRREKSISDVAKMFVQIFDRQHRHVELLLRQLQRLIES